MEKSKLSMDNFKQTTDIVLDLENNNMVEHINELKRLIIDQNQDREKDKKYLTSIKLNVDEMKDQNEEIVDKIFNLEKHYKSIASNIKDIRQQLEHLDPYSEEGPKHHHHSPLLSRLERGEKCSNEDKPSRLLSVVYFKGSDLRTENINKK